MPGSIIILFNSYEMMFIFISIILLMTAAPSSADCPDDWMPYKDFCFRTSKEKVSSFILAEHACHKLHPSAHLASIHNAEENRVASNAAKNETSWIGLKRIRGRFRWSDKTFLDFTSWADAAAGPSNSSCLQMGGNAKWVSTDCGDEYKRKNSKTKEKAGSKKAGSKKQKKKSKRAVYGGANSRLPSPHYLSHLEAVRVKRHRRCKRNIRVAEPCHRHMKRNNGAPALCKVPHMQTCGGPDWIRAGEFCYNFSSPLDKRDWHQSSAGCLEMDAKFVAVFNARQNDVLRRLAHLTGANVWLGLIHTEDGFHRWADGAIMTYDNFASPSHYDASHQCVYMDELTGLWLHEQCNTPMEYVCMRPKLQLYDARTANASRPRATVEIWRRIEEALVPARGPPPGLSMSGTTRQPPTPEPIDMQAQSELRASIQEEVDEGPNRIRAGLSADSGGVAAAEAPAAEAPAAPGEPPPPPIQDAGDGQAPVPAAVMPPAG